MPACTPFGHLWRPRSTACTVLADVVHPSSHRRTGPSRHTKSAASSSAALIGGKPEAHGLIDSQPALQPADIARLPLCGGHSLPNRTRIDHRPGVAFKSPTQIRERIFAASYEFEVAIIDAII